MGTKSGFITEVVAKLNYPGSSPFSGSSSPEPPASSSKPNFPGAGLGPALGPARGFFLPFSPPVFASKTVALSHRYLCRARLRGQWARTAGFLERSGSIPVL